MPHKFDPRQKDLLLAEERQAELQPEKLLRRLGLRAGDTMADIGAGPGFFTLPAAEIVGPDGVVYAADIQGEMLTSVRSRAAQAGYTNVRLIKSSESGVPIAPESCDFILMAYTLHELEQHATFLHRLARLLKPEGRIVVIEWEKIEQPIGPPMQDRIAPDALRGDAEAAGLLVEREESLNESSYLFLLVPTKIRVPTDEEPRVQAV